MPEVNVYLIEVCTLGFLLEYPTPVNFKWYISKNGPYTYTVNVQNGRLF